MMKPRTFKQSDAAHRAAKRRAKRLGISFSAYIRELIAKDARRAERTKRRAA